MTGEGARILEEAPSLLQDRFRAELAHLEEWERHWLLSALERIATMMDAESIDAAPILETGPVSPPPEESGIREDGARIDEGDGATTPHEPTRS